jgi:hypothetical protein
MRYLIKVTEQYRCDTEEEARVLIEEAKKDSQYTVIKSSSEIKTVKSKGEVIDEYRRVMITKEFTTEREPDCQIRPEYMEDE